MIEYAGAVRSGHLALKAANEPKQEQSLVAYLCDQVKGITPPVWMFLAMLVAVGLLLYWAGGF
jgi:hypothetical protein